MKITKNYEHSVRNLVVTLHRENESRTKTMRYAHTAKQSGKGYCSQVC